MLKAYDLIGPKLYNRFWSAGEDMMTSYALFKIANNYKNIKLIGIYNLVGNKRNKYIGKTETFIKKYKIFKYLNFIETILNIVKIYPNDKDILLKELFWFNKYYKNCFNENIKEESIRILNGILELNNIGQKVRNKINSIINRCIKMNK